MRDAFSIGGVEVAPGRRKIIDLPIMDVSTRTPMTMPVQVVNGRRDGPRLFVCATLHGDEINGVEIIRRLLRPSALRRLRGSLVAGTQVAARALDAFEPEAEYEVGPTSELADEPPIV